MIRRPVITATAGIAALAATAALALAAPARAGAEVARVACLTVSF